MAAECNEAYACSVSLRSGVAQQTPSPVTAMGRS